MASLIRSSRPKYLKAEVFSLSDSLFVVTGATIPFVKHDAEISGISLFECLLLDSQKQGCVNEPISISFF
jgi:hypothetical protein